MLGGVEVTAKAREHAREMLQVADAARSACSRGDAAIARSGQR